MIKFKIDKIFNAIKRKLGFKNKSENIVIHLKVVLYGDISKLSIEIPIDEEDKLHE